MQVALFYHQDRRTVRLEVSARWKVQACRTHQSRARYSQSPLYMRLGLSLLKLLRHLGMPVDHLSTVAYAIIVSRILYALPSWGGFLSSDLTNRIDAFLRRLRRFGCINRTISVCDLLHNSDTQFFSKMCLPGHSLYHLFPPQRICTNLRSRGHNFQLPDYCSALRKRSFVIRTLFEFV